MKSLRDILKKRYVEKMVRLEGAGPGEAVTIAVIKQFRGLSDDDLNSMRGAGVSDQKVALINAIFAERAAGARRFSERQLMRRFAEQRRIVRPQITVGVARILRRAVLRKSISAKQARQFIAKTATGRFFPSNKEAEQFISRTKKIAAPEIRVKPSRVITPKIKTASLREAAREIKVMEKKVSDDLKKLGLTDKNIERFVKGPGTISITKLKSLGVSDENIRRITQLRRDVEQTLVGTITGLRDKPVKTATIFLLAKRAPFLFKFVGKTKIAKGVGKVIPKGLQKFGKAAIPPALITAYVAGSGLEISRLPREKRARAIGEKISTEVLPFHLGTKSGVRGLLRKEIQTELKKELSKLSKDKRAAFIELMRKADLLKKTEATLRNVNLQRLRRIPNKAKPIIIKFLKEKDIVVGGSLGQQTAVKVRRTLAQSDLDLYTEKNPIKAAGDLVKRLQGRGIKRVSQVRVRGKPTGRVTIAGKKAAEFHNINRLLTNIESVIPGWRLPKSFIVRTKNGIRVPKITIQLKRKLIGGFTEPHRSKDLKDARDILNQLFKRAELKARRKFFFRKKNIKALEKVFGVKINKKTLIKDILKLKLTKKFKKPRVLIKKPSLKVGRGIRRKKISRKVKKRPKISQRKRRRPSQPPIKRFRPSQRLVKRRRRRGPPSQIPRRRKRRGPPPTKITERVSQLPRPRRPGGPPPPPPPPPTTRITRRVPPPTKKPPKALIFRRKIKRKRRIGTVQVYNVFGKDRGRFIKLNRRPLSKNDARSRMTFALDHTTSRTGKITPAGTSRKPGRINLKEKRYFQRHRKKLRNFKIRKGKKKILINKYIERTKHAIDTRGEKRQLSLARFAKQQGFTKPIKRVRRRPARRSPTRRAPTLQRNSKGQFIKRRR